MVIWDTGQIGFWKKGWLLLHSKRDDEWMAAHTDLVMRRYCGMYYVVSTSSGNFEAGDVLRTKESWTVGGTWTRCWPVAVVVRGDHSGLSVLNEHLRLVTINESNSKLLCCKILVQQCLAPWMLAWRKHVAGLISGGYKLDVMEGERAQGIESICKRVILKKGSGTRAIEGGKWIPEGVGR